ncbi:MAG TPA: 2,3-bisphosphoglycerate-independent phosphoglycerate mutase, partial [Firmicutes bacterium]|nr:2,3-bisphosphoglycerate-independent phosphoglycerate mutase [Bacillota bacterium]
NFRPDRMRQITRALVDEDFSWFSRQEGLRVHYLCMTQYDETIKAPVAYPPERLVNTLGQVVSAQGLQQLRIAETEKYAHVTYFFNGGEEKALPGEERVLIPSPKVETYDLQPEMSAESVTAAACSHIASQKFSLVVLNYANPDMVGHTGNFAATVQACQVVDQCVGRVWTATEAAGGAMLLFSDHGNADLMV